MSNDPLSPIGRIIPDRANRLNQVDQALVGQVEPQAHSESEAAPANPEPAARINPEATSLPNISLHFKIDAQTNQVTVLILDKATREVIRTIPAEELNQLRQGELLELFR